MAIMAGRPDLVAEALAEGVHVGTAVLRHEAWETDDEAQVGYLAIESEVLLYHAVEALLRLLIAHYPHNSSSPALNLAALTSHRAFYNEVRRHFLDSSDDQLEHLVERTVHGFRSPEGMPEIDHSAFTAEAARQGKENLREILRYLGRFILEDNRRYVNNSAKHGLAVRSGEHGFRIGGGSPEDPVIIDQHGQALSCLAVRTEQMSGQTVVDEVVVWSNPVRNIALINLVLDIMESAWLIGKNRVLGDPGVLIRLFDTYGLHDILSLSRSSGPTTGEGLPFVEIPHMRLPLGIALATLDAEADDNADAINDNSRNDSADGTPPTGS